MNEIILVQPQDLKRATLLLNRTNIAIKRLNSIAEEIVEYEIQQSIYIKENEKLSQSMGVTKLILKDIDALIEEEKTLRNKLRTIPAIQFIKKRNYLDRIDEIASLIRQKEAQIAELKKDQKQLITKINCAKHMMNRTKNATTTYFIIANREYNPLIHNLNCLTGLDLEPITEDKIEPLETLEITFKNSNNEESDNETLYI